MALSGRQATPASAAAAASSRPLLVPAADVLARNMRAVEQASNQSTGSGFLSGATPSFFMSLGRGTETSTRKQKHIQARFRSAASMARPSALSAFLSRLFGGSKGHKKEDGDSSENSTKNGDSTADAKKQPSKLQKVIPVLQKIAPLLSNLPDPMYILLGLSFLILVVKRLRPKWLQLLPVQIASITLLFIPLLLSVVWRRTGLLVMLKEERPLRTHPAELRLDLPESAVRARDKAVEKELDLLRKNEAKLDALKKELGKEGNARNADGQIIPSRRAAEMIADGALGAGFDEETAAEVEHRRREENMKRSREEWRLRAEMAVEDDIEMKQSLKLLEDHAAAPYTKRTKDLKTRSSPTTNAADKLNNLKKMVQTAAAVRALQEEAKRVDRHSERSMPVSGRDASGASRRRLTLFRRKRRETAPELDARLTMSESGHAMHN